jgi:hypothetical protein
MNRNEKQGHRLNGYLNLKRYILDPISKNLGNRLENYAYYDICKEDELATNSTGIDIVSHQMELKFRNVTPIFFSYSTVNTWMQYSLCISDKPFVKGVHKFSKKDKNWECIIGKSLVDFQVYGYTEWTFKSTETKSGKTTEETYFQEPHLLVLKFENMKVLGIGNFYLENDFIPKVSFGDDIWIIFDWKNINNCIENLALEKLSTANPS